MELNITGKNISLTEALKQHVKDKIKKAEEHFDHIGNVEVFLFKDNIEFVAEIKMHVNGADLFAKESSDDMYKSIDLMAKKIDKQVVKHKEKISSFKNESIKKEN